MKVSIYRSWVFCWYSGFSHLKLENPFVRFVLLCGHLAHRADTKEHKAGIFMAILHFLNTMEEIALPTKLRPAEKQLRWNTPLWRKKPFYLLNLSDKFYNDKMDTLPIADEETTNTQRRVSTTCHFIIFNRHRWCKYY